jgi:hypothetical protein
MAIAGSFSLTGEKEAAPPEFYADAAVIAYMLPEGDLDLASLQPGITSSGGKFNLAALTDGDLVTTALLPYTKPGENTLEIKVTDLWVNRLIGDQQPGISKKITYTTMPFYRADSPLLPSGLLGPVKIYSITN